MILKKAISYSYYFYDSGYTEVYKILRSVGASLFIHTSTQSLCLHLAATSGSRPICDMICKEMIQEETINRMNLCKNDQQNLENNSYQRKDSILETQDQDGL